MRLNDRTIMFALTERGKSSFWVRGDSGEGDEFGDFESEHLVRSESNLTKMILNQKGRSVTFITGKFRGTFGISDMVLGMAGFRLQMM